MMKKIRVKKNLHYLIQIIILLIIISIGYFFTNGIPLFGVPEIEDVSYIEISDTRLDINARKITEIEDMENEINLTNLLSYKLGTPEQKQPLIEFIFHLKNDKSFIISLNEKSVYINGKAYSLTDDNGKTFIKVTEAIFFFDDLVKKEEDK